MASYSDNPLEPQTLLNSLKNEKTITIFASSNLYRFIIVSIRLANWAMRAAIFPF